MIQGKEGGPDRALRLSFFRILPEIDENRRLDAMLAYRLAPVLGGGKPAELISFSPGDPGLFKAWKRRGSSLVESWGLETFALREHANCECAVIYDAEAVCRGLGDPRAVRMLKGFGYESLEGASWKERLRCRFQGKCPHELGLFLGIPYGDVRGFIAHEGANYLFQGYWKVYERPDYARALFSEFDGRKDAAIRRWFAEASNVKDEGAGRRIGETICRN